MKTKSVLICVICVICGLTSCKTTKLSTESNQTSEAQQTDSVSVLVERETKPVIVPQATATFNVSFDQLDSLPAGASYQQKSGNATGTITKNNDNTLTITANCDSLILLVESLKKEVYHFQSENTTLKSELNERQTQVLKEPSSWQWFQIYGFRILLIINLIIILIAILWKKMKKI